MLMPLPARNPLWGVPGRGSRADSSRSPSRWCRSRSAVRPSVIWLAAASGVYVLSTSGSVAPATARSAIVTTSSNTRRPFGYPAASLAMSPRLFAPRLVGGNRQVESQHVGLHRAHAVLEAGHDAGRDAGEEDGHQIVAFRGGLVVGLQVREHARVQSRQELGQFGVEHRRGELLVVDRLLGVPVVLLRHRHDDLVDQRVTQP